MGSICFKSISQAEKLEIMRSAQLDNDLEGALKLDKRVIRLLLLGTGESGKSTLFKQMELLYTDGFTDSNRLNFSNVIRKNLLDSAQCLINGVHKFGLELDSERVVEAANYVSNLNGFSLSSILPQIEDSIKILWNESHAIQEVYRRRNEINLSDSTEYFMNNLTEIMRTDFMPDNDDILRARLRTTGIVESDFNIDGVVFTFIDVGGQRNERKKWIHCFSSVTSLLFVVAVNEFDQTLFEDENTNRMLESLQVFEKTVNSEHFINTPVIIFLNKEDLLQEKLSNGINPSIVFPNYKGGNDLERCEVFLTDKYVSLVKNSNRETFAHMTTAIDTQNVKRVWNACRGICLRNALEDSGLTF